MAWLYVGSGAFLGANARHWLGTWAAERFGAVFPYGTFVINATGSFAIGILVSYFATRSGSPGWRLFLMVGVLGGYTTFSAYSLEAARLLDDGSYGLALAYFAGSPLAGLAACFCGMALGKLM